MSTHDARNERGRDDWEVAGRDAAALARGLHAMADDVAPHPLDDRLGTVRGRVRRRRAAKKAGAGVVTLGVVGALGVALTQVPGWDTAQPLPAGPTGPDYSLCGTTVDLDPGLGASLAHDITLQGDARVPAGDAWTGMLLVSGSTASDGALPDESVRLTDVGLVVTDGLEVVGVPDVRVRTSQEAVVVNGSSGPQVESWFVGCADGDASPLPSGDYDVYATAVLHPGVGELDVVAGPARLSVVEDEADHRGDSSEAPRKLASGPPVVEEGHQPSWLEHTDLVCGMPATDLVATSSPLRIRLQPDAGYGVELPRWYEDASTADLTSFVYLPVTITETAGEALEGFGTGGAAVLWIQEGRVVDVGLNVWEAPEEFSVDAGGDVREEAVDTLRSTCAPEPDGTYLTDLPAGEYELVAYREVFPDMDPGAEDAIRLVSEPVAVRLATDGQVLRRD